MMLGAGYAMENRYECTTPAMRSEGWISDQIHGMDPSETAREVKEEDV